MLDTRQLPRIRAAIPRGQVALAYTDGQLVNEAQFEGVGLVVLADGFFQAAIISDHTPYRMI